MNLTPIADGLRKYLRTGLGMVGDIQTQGAGGGGGGGVTIGTTAITGGTDTRVLFDDGEKVGESAGLTYVKASGTLTATAVVGGNITDSALTATRLTIAGTAGLLGDDGNLVWDATNKRLTVGSTANGTSTGAFIGYGLTSGMFGIWNAALTPSANNFALSQDSNGNTFVNAATGRQLIFSINNGTGTLGISAGGVYLASGTRFIFGSAAPTLASGGCTSPTGVTSNGTARFSVGVGTGCAGSQPLVFTLPSNNAGWNCYAQNSSSAASSIPRQSSAISATSVTITNYAATTGLATGWTDADVVVVSCLGG